MLNPRRILALRLWMVILLLAFRSLEAPAAVVPVPSQDYMIQGWNTDDGLPQSSVTSITQTPDGYLWFGTFDGLVRFDGVRFKIFDSENTPALAGPGILKLFVDSQGRMWIAMIDAGVACLNQGHFSRFTQNDGLPPGNITAFSETRDGKLQVATSSGQIAEWNGSKFTKPASPAGLGATATSSLVRDNADNLYAARLNSFSWLSSTGWVAISTPRGSTSPAIQASCPAKAGGLWVTIQGQIGRIQQGAFVQKLSALPWPDEIRAFTMMEDSQGLLWIGTYGAGLFYGRNGEWHRLSTAEGLTHDVVRHVFEDREGCVWVGTDGGGLIRLKQKLFTNFNKKQGLPENIVNALCEISPGELWIGTHGSGIARLKDGIINKVEFPPRLNNRWIFAMHRDSKGRIWGGTFGPRLFFFANEKYEELTLPNLRLRQAITAILEGKQGNVWVATLNGLFSYEEGKLRQVEGLASEAIHALVEDKEGKLWIGTELGLEYIKDSLPVHYQAAQSLPKVYALLQADGALWIGLNKKGLARLKDGHLTLFPKEAGLPSDSVQSLMDDQVGNLWASGNHGVFRIRFSELNAYAEKRSDTLEGFMYGKDDGLGATECPGGHQHNICRTSDGKLWFGTVGGASVIDPATLRPNTNTPPVWIEEVLADTAELRPTLAASSDTTLKISPGTRAMEIHYTALSYLAPKQVLFKYRLEGFDPSWTIAGNRRTAYYQGLPPGEYRFIVTACNEHGVWNKTGASALIQVLPYVWQSAWFEGVVSLGFASAAWFFYRRRIRLLEKQREAQRVFSAKLIESQEHERKRLASELHDGLGQNLLIIKNRVAAALENPAQVTEQLGEISLSATEAIQEVRTISHNLRPYQLDRLGLTKALEALVKQVANPHLHLTAEIANVDKCLVREQEINFYRIIQESLNNVLKHSGATDAKLMVTRGEDSIIATVQDNGRGFDYKGIMSDPQSRRGLGLTGLSERAHLLGGRLEIRSAIGAGTTLELTAPVVGPASVQT